MIRLIDIRLNAAHPDLPLAEAVTYTGAPSTVLIRGVPGNCGRWAITAVFVAATYPDGSTTTRLAVQSANGVWVATIPATATSGRTEHGLRILADGVDENGEAVSGYVLGVADFAVASLGIAPAPEPGETSYQMLYFDAVPSVPRKGDVVKTDGSLKFYNGTAWEAFATLNDAVTRTSSNGVKSSGIWAAIWGALTALPGFSSLYDWCVSQLAGKQDALTAQQIANIAAVPDKANRAANPTAGNLAALDAQGNPTNSGVKPSDFALASRIPAAGTATPKMDGTASPGVSAAYARNDHVHPAETAVSTTYGLPASAFPIVFQYDGETFTVQDSSEVSLEIFPDGPDEGNYGLYYPIISEDFCIAMFDATSLRYRQSAESPISPAVITFNGVAPVSDTTPVLESIPASVSVRGVEVAMKGDLRYSYSLVTKTPNGFGIVVLDDRAQNIVSISSALASLTIVMPTATPSKVRDCGLRINIAAGITAPEISLAAGETGGFYTSDGEIPEIADGGTDGSVTLFYFTEITANQFLVKSESLKPISQQ